VLCKKVENETGNQFTSQIIIPQRLVADVLEQLHSSVTGGHLGLNKTFNKIRQKYHWYKMYRDIERSCQKCDGSSMVCGFLVPLKTCGVVASPYKAIDTPISHIGA